MKKLQKQDYINLTILITLFLLLVLYLTKFTYLYGSTTDYESQHWVFADYFRTLFYQSGKILPDFALNLGAGQNAYNFAYYGFLSPIILISYLFPFISMIDYFAISSILIVIISTILFYRFLLNNNYNRTVTFITTLIFLCASPLIFHSHRHIMFISYMPFLIMGLMGVDNYFKQNKKGLLILSIFLIIMTSYYYSVGSILTLTLYGIFTYLKLNKTFKIKEFLNKGLKFAGLVLLGIGTAGILLLPVMAIIIKGRTGVTVSVDLNSLITPRLNLNYLLYDSYALGLTSISVFGIIGAFIKQKKEWILLGIVTSLIIIFPIFNYILNGTLYIGSKSLIPFLPIFILMIGEFITNILDKKVKYLPLIIGAFIIILINVLTINWKYNYVFYLDIGIMLLSFIVYKYYSNKKVIIIPLILEVIAMSILINQGDVLIPITKYNNTYTVDKTTLINDTLDNDSNFYRFNNLIDTLPTINKIYDINYYQTSLYSSTNNIYYNTFFNKEFNNAIVYRNSVITAQSSNLLFQSLMGVKYVMSDFDLGLGYKLINSNNNLKMYENESNYPLGYATNNVSSKEYFDTLEYPYNIEALMTSIISENVSNNKISSNLKPLNPDYEIVDSNNLKLTKKDNIYYLEASENNNLTIKLNNNLDNQIILLRFKMLLSQNCSQGDTAITINNVTNKLTCKQWKYHNQNYDFDYVLSGNTFNLTFTKGKYQIDNIELFTLDYNVLTTTKNNLDPFVINKMPNNGDTINGNINVTNDGYFMLTIPYDKNFTITLDNKQINYELVNESFIGFPITKGEHNITINYHASWKKEGIIISLVSLVITLIIVFYRKNMYNGDGVERNGKNKYHRSLLQRGRKH